jgi:hypothetical protein
LSERDALSSLIRKPPRQPRPLGRRQLPPPNRRQPEPRSSALRSRFQLPGWPVRDVAIEVTFEILLVVAPIQKQRQRPLHHDAAAPVEGRLLRASRSGDISK